MPGLDTIIPEIAEGRVVVVESGADSAKSFFIRRLALTAIRNHARVTFLISRDAAELHTQLKNEGALEDWLEENVSIHELNSVDHLDEYAGDGGLLAVDSFSLLTLDLPPEQLAPMLRKLRAVCSDRRTMVVLATDQGMFEPRAEAVTTHLADGVIQFQSKEGPEGLVRYLRIPKWMQGKFVDRNIYYEFDGSRLAIDLRRRVL